MTLIRLRREERKPRLVKPIVRKGLLVLPMGNAELDTEALAVVNGKTLSEGESASASVKPGTLTIKCLKIEKNSVFVTVEGEDTPRLPHLR